MAEATKFAPRLKIVSDGTGRGTKVYDAKTGADLTDALMLRAVKWEIVEGTKIAKATLECYAQVEVESDAEVVHVPLPERLARAEVTR